MVLTLWRCRKWPFLDENRVDLDGGKVWWMIGREQVTHSTVSFWIELEFRRFLLTVVCADGVASNVCWAFCAAEFSCGSATCAQCKQKKAMFSLVWAKHRDQNESGPKKEPHQLPPGYGPNKTDGQHVNTHLHTHTHDAALFFGQFTRPKDENCANFRVSI